MFLATTFPKSAIFHVCIILFPFLAVRSTWIKYEEKLYYVSHYNNTDIYLITQNHMINMCIIIIYVSPISFTKFAIAKKSCSKFKTYPIVQQHDNRVRYKFYQLEHFLLFYVTNANYLGLKMSQIISTHFFPINDMYYSS